MSAEGAHHAILSLLKSAPNLLGKAAALTMGAPDSRLQRKAFGVNLAGPVGLAAGLDKDGYAVEFWPSLGFGFIELGTVTAHPQPGNPKPRLFRYPTHGALLNRMGFNNEGSDALRNRLALLKTRGTWPSVPVGINIGKSKVTPADEAAEDYVTSTKRLVEFADYLVVNVSSPNTPGLRDLQTSEALNQLLPPILKAANGTPTLLKLSPDLREDETIGAIETAKSQGISGIIATNTTTTRPDLPTQAQDEAGGVSGRPLWPMAKARIQLVCDVCSDDLAVIGVGGIYTPEQVNECLTMGCVAVQLYTGLIYEGPGLPHRINQALVQSLP